MIVIVIAIMDISSNSASLQNSPTMKHANVTAIYNVSIQNILTKMNASAFAIKHGFNNGAINKASSPTMTIAHATAKRLVSFLTTSTRKHVNANAMKPICGRPTVQPQNIFLILLSAIVTATKLGCISNATQMKSPTLKHVNAIALYSALLLNISTKLNAFVSVIIMNFKNSAIPRKKLSITINVDVIVIFHGSRIGALLKTGM